MPKSIDNLSLSISNPLINMELSKFAINFFEMYSRAKNNSFYYKDLVSFLSNIFLRISYANDLDSFEKIRLDIVNKNMVYVAASYILSIVKDKKIKKLFNCTENNIIDVLDEFIEIFELKIDENTFLEQSSKIKATLQILSLIHI